jgi:hypothetical protein
MIFRYAFACAVGLAFAGGTAGAIDLCHESLVGPRPGRGHSPEARWLRDSPGWLHAEVVEYIEALRAEGRWNEETRGALARIVPAIDLLPLNGEHARNGKEAIAAVLDLLVAVAVGPNPLRPFTLEEAIADFPEWRLRFVWGRDGADLDEDPAVAVRRVLELLAIARDRGPGQFARLAQWIDSPGKALHFYLNIGKFPDGARWLTELLWDHPQFRGALRSPESPGTLMTLSIEKEILNRAASTMLVRTRDFTDEQWLALDPDVRFAALRGLRRQDKDVFVPVPTAFLPRFVGNPNFEETYGNILIEAKTKGFSISVDGAIAQLGELAELTGETHSFQAHLGFALPAARAQELMQYYGPWWKHLNDYLYFRGLEEGLHGNGFAQPAHLANIFQKKLPGEGISDDLLTHEEKLHPGGHRLWVYEPHGTDPASLIFFGLELRDPTRSLVEWERLIREIAESISTGRWQRQADPFETHRFMREHPFYGASDFVALGNAEFAQEYPALDRDLRAALQYWGGFGSQAQPVHLPFVHFEDLRFLNFRGGGTKEAPPAARERILSARAYYARELRRIRGNLLRNRQAGIATSPVDTAVAFQMTLTEWARLARISELFSGF